MERSPTPAPAIDPAGTLACGVFLEAPNEISDPDFGHFRDVLNGHFYPAEVEALDSATVMRAPRLSAVHLSMTTFGYVRFGAAASVDPGDLSAYHVNVALSGEVVSRCGDQVATASPRVATVFSPDRLTSLPRWGADAAQLSIKLERHRVEEQLSEMLGRQVVKPVNFQLALPLEGAGLRWLSVLSAVLEFMQGPQTRAISRHLETLERSLITGLLLCQPNSYTEALTAEGGPQAPLSAVDRVVEEIQRAPDRGYTVADLAAIAGTSARSLQYAFAEHHGTTPMRYLRQVRLDRVRDELVEGSSTVSDTAYHWGFTNLGRFAHAYRDRFGESPAATLERRSTRSRG